MTNGTSGASAPKRIIIVKPVELSYLKIRDVTTKDEEANGASTYVAVLPAAEILKVKTAERLRSYIPAHAGEQRNLAHKAIARTIRDEPDRFSQLNSGFLIGASSIAIDDAKKIATLGQPSLNGGAQSQGEIKLYLDECAESGKRLVDFAIRCELSIEPHDETRTNIAVARNTSTKIEGISIAGKHEYFKDLRASFQKVHPHLDLARSESDVDGKYVDTRLLLQVLWAMMPQELQREYQRHVLHRMDSCINAACLRDFIRIADTRGTDQERAAQYAYFVDMAGSAWEEYQRWKTEGWKEDNSVEAEDGIVFPILSALSTFVKKGSDGHWKIVYPQVFRHEDMRNAAQRQLWQCEGSAMLMRRSGAAHEALMILAEMAERYSEQVATSSSSSSSTVVTPVFKRRI